jgi:hypothetical protein
MRAGRGPCVRTRLLRWAAVLPVFAVLMGQPRADTGRVAQSRAPLLLLPHPRPPPPSAQPLPPPCYRQMRLRGGGAARDGGAELPSQAPRGGRRPRKTRTSERGGGAAAGDSALQLLPAEVREQAGADIDGWGRPRHDPGRTHGAGLPRPGSPTRPGGGSAERCGAPSAGGGRARRRRMISFDIAEIYPRCRGWNITFTSPLKPTASELEAAVAAVRRRMLQHVAGMPQPELIQQAREACAAGVADRLIADGVIPECVKLAFDPDIDALQARLRSKLSSVASDADADGRDASNLEPTAERERARSGRSSSSQTRCVTS